MKTKSTLITLAVSLSALSLGPLPSTLVPGRWEPVMFAQEKESSKRTPEWDGELEDRKGWAEWFIQQRAFPFGAIPLGARERAMTYVQRVMRPGLQALRSTRLAENTWELIGPTSIPEGQTPGGSAPVSGRVTAIAVDPRNPRTIYLGGAQGGVWKSTDNGATWLPLTDGQPSLAIGSLAIDPTNPDIIYAGTGQGDLAVGSYFGAGVLKSTDGGATWAQFAASTFAGLALPDLIIDPSNPQTLYAAAAIGFNGVSGDVLPGVGNRGVFKSSDGGVTWRRLMSGLPSGSGNNTGVQDLAMDPTNPQVIYAAFNSVGIFRTTNGGNNWSRLAGTGFPTGGFGRIAVSVAPTSSQTLYAALEDSTNEELLNLFKSTDGGANWTTLARPPAGGRICLCFFDNVVAASPRDANTVFFGGVGFFRSTNGGTSWNYLNFSSKIHVDVHAIVFDPSNPSRVLVGNDGGIWASTNNGGSWANLNNNLSLTQFNYIAAHPTDVMTLYGGTQDNGTLKYTGTTTWSFSQGGDGGAVLIDPSNPDTVYHTFFEVSFERSDDGGASWTRKMEGLIAGERSLFFVPIAMDPSNPRTLYLGSLRLFKTTNRAENWTTVNPDLTAGFGAISAIAVAPTASSTIYVGTSDGNLQVTTDGGDSWRNLNAGLPIRYVSRIVVDPTDARTAYVSYSGFRSGHVFKTTNGGMSWTNISGNLPDIPANALVLDSSVPNKLYVGTDIGVFVTLNGGGAWTEIDQGMPNSVVWDLQINNRTNSLFAATYGRGVYRLSLVP